MKSFILQQIQNLIMQEQQDQYNEDNIRSLDWKEHIRMRPGSILENWEMVPHQMMVFKIGRAHV